MKSEKVEELMDWLNSKMRMIDLPRDYSNMEVNLLVEIAELEKDGSDKLDEKVKEFKDRYQ